MKDKSVILIAAAVLLAVVGIVAVVVLASGNNTPSVDDSMMEKEDDGMMNDEKMEEDKMDGEDSMEDGDEMKKDDDKMMDDKSSQGGHYKEYSTDAVSASGAEDKVLFFYAGWCPSCRQQDDNLEASKSSIPSTLDIFKVDFDTEIQLRQKYGVTGQHTFVQIDDKGNKVKSWNSLYMDYDLQSILDKIS